MRTGKWQRSNSCISSRADRGLTMCLSIFPCLGKIMPCRCPRLLFLLLHHEVPNYEFLSTILFLLLVTLSPLSHLLSIQMSMETRGDRGPPAKGEPSRIQVHLLERHPLFAILQRQLPTWHFGTPRIRTTTPHLLAQTGRFIHLPHSAVQIPDDAADQIPGCSPIRFVGIINRGPSDEVLPLGRAGASGG